MKHGADVDLEDSMGKSAITVARNSDILLAFFTSNNEFSTTTAESRLSLEDDHESEHDSGDEKEHFIAIEDAIRDRGKLDHTLVHGVFVGPPRSGKDSLMKRLLGEMPTDTSPSTGVAENVVHVKVEESSTFAATVEQSNWTRLAYDEEALHLMKMASNKTSDTDQGESGGDEQLTEGLGLGVEETPNLNLQAYVIEETLQIHITSDKQTIIPQSAPLLEEQVFQATEHPLQVSRHKPPLEIFKEAIKNKGLEGLKRQLAKSRSVYLTNTCLLYTSPSPRDATLARMPSSA